MNARTIFTYNLKREMDRNNVSAKELSAGTGIPYTTILDWIKGNKMPRIDKLDLLADFFKIPLSDLFRSPDDRKYFTKDEWELIGYYRDMDLATKKAFQKFINGWLAELRVDELEDEIDRLKRSGATACTYQYSSNNLSMVAEESGIYNTDKNK